MKTRGAKSLSDVLKKAGASQYAAAKLLRITQPQVSHLLAGSRRPSLRLAIRIQRQFGIAAAEWE